MRRIQLITVLFLLACGESSTVPLGLAVMIEPPGPGLIVGIGNTRDYRASATDYFGQVIYGQTITWSTENAAIATIDQNGLATGVSEGETTVMAAIGGMKQSVPLEVYVPEVITSYQAGTSYFGRNNYVEYVPGGLPVVISATHGGSLRPSEIKDRSYGVTNSDRNTIELSIAVRDALIEVTGSAPPLVLSHLHRSKLDPNRELLEAAQGDPFAENAWHEFQDWIMEARDVVSQEHERGLYLDMHGHGHTIPRIEIGYLLSSTDLNQSDSALNNMTIVEKTSIRDLGYHAPEAFWELVRGPKSFGGLLEDEGVPSIPSPSDPYPGTDPYFTGGYNTRIHGSRSAGEVVNGIQLEHPYPGFRDSDANRQVYATQLASVIQLFMIEHF